MAIYWYINISTEDQSVIPKATMDFIIANWNNISRSKEMPSENSVKIYLSTICGDRAINFLDNLAKTSDGIKMGFTSETTMCTEQHIHISKNGNWEHIETIVEELDEEIIYCNYNEYQI